MNKVWTIETADHKFSKFILARDPICQRCKRNPSTDCSHFYERHHKSVRFSPINCVGLCRSCHEYFHSNRPEYKNFMLRRIGMDGYLALQRISAMILKPDVAIYRLMKMLKQLPDDPCPLGHCDGSGIIDRNDVLINCPHKIEEDNG